MDKEIKCQNYTLAEVANIIQNKEVVIADETSRLVLAKWLRELDRYRAAAYSIRAALAKV